MTFIYEVISCYPKTCNNRLWSHAVCQWRGPNVLMSYSLFAQLYKSFICGRRLKSNDWGEVGFCFCQKFQARSMKSETWWLLLKFNSTQTAGFVSVMSPYQWQRPCRTSLNWCLATYLRWVNIQLPEWNLNHHQWVCRWVLSLQRHICYSLFGSWKKKIFSAQCGSVFQSGQVFLGFSFNFVRNRALINQLSLKQW